MKSKTFIIKEEYTYPDMVFELLDKADKESKIILDHIDWNFARKIWEAHGLIDVFEPIKQTAVPCDLLNVEIHVEFAYKDDWLTPKGRRILEEYRKQNEVKASKKS